MRYVRGKTYRASRVDENQPVIVAALRAVGATVLLLHEVGHGCPDILVGYRGVNYLLEVKNPEGRQVLGAAQKIFQKNWHGQAAVVNSIQEAYAVIGVECDIF